MIADLHTHTTASDGELQPEELIERAREAGVEMLSITDHDTMAAYASIGDAAHGSINYGSIKIIPGIELSSIWRNTGIHIIGLNVALDEPKLLAGIKAQQSVRQRRAKTIAEKLAKLGFDDTLAGALRLAGDAPIGRPHFARYLVESGQIANEKAAFKKHLGQGKSCDVRNEWPVPETVIRWITEAGGQAVLAHPAKYKLTNLKLEELTTDFGSAGGHGIEVVCGQQDSRLTHRLGQLAARHGLLASSGSDFHRPGQPWAAIGRIAALPDDCTPVWERW
jgi:predicted metal-dependent phosphoesterase TrpH